MHNLKNKDSKQQDVDIYWQKKSRNFSAHYNKKQKSFYQRFVNRFLNSRFDIISDLIKKDINQDSIIVDIGCGSGIYLNYCAGFNPREIIGIDYSESMINQVKEGGLDNIKLIKASAEKLNLADQSCNLVLAIGLFDYLSNPSRAMGEISRILQKDGRAIITLPKKYSPLVFLRYWPGLYLRKYLLKLPPIINWWSKKNAEIMFDKLEFEIIDIKQVQRTMWIFELAKK